jgi:hypothetical protein
MEYEYCITGLDARGQSVDTTCYDQDWVDVEQTLLAYDIELLGKGTVLMESTARAIMSLRYAVQTLPGGHRHH